MIARTLVVFVILTLGIIALFLPQTSNLAHSEPNTAQPSPSTNPQIPTKAKAFQPPPETSAQSIAIVDARTGAFLYEKNSNLRLLPASTTKMMTALVALANCSPNDKVVVRSLQKDGTQMGLELGDEVTVENLLHGLLISSGNDAAYALANSCAPTYKDFIEAMNQKAKELDMQDSRFVNPAGFDDNLQYSTARDLAKLGKVVVANPLVAKIVATKSTVVTDVSGNRIYFLDNVNKLLGVVDGVEGVKTGQTEGSLEILVTKTTRGGNSLIISLMGSQDRFTETKKLIDWVYQNYVWNAT